MSWYSASHAELATYLQNQDIRKWDWADEGLWDWQGGNILDHSPRRVSDNLEGCEFNPAQTYLERGPEGINSLPEGGDAPPEVEMLVGKRELTPRAIEYQVK